MTDVGIFIAFAAGLVSFLAPCVLPVIPGFLAFLGGTSLADQQTFSRKSVFISSLFFVAGFVLVFSTLGILLNTLLESVAYDAQIWLARTGGLLIIFFGLYLTGLLKVPFLEREHKLRFNVAGHGRQLSAFLFGVAFAAGWTPCVGAALGAILGLAASQPGSAFTLLLAYSIGLGVPFLIVGLFAPEVRKLVSGGGKWLRAVNISFGVILIIFGILVFTQRLSRIANFEFIMNLLGH